MRALRIFLPVRCLCFGTGIAFTLELVYRRRLDRIAPQPVLTSLKQDP